MDAEILKLIRERGLLLEKEIYDLIDQITDVRIARNFLEQLERVSGKKIITRNVLGSNVEYVRGFVGNLQEGDKTCVERVFINLGISLEVRREIGVRREEGMKQEYKIIYSNTSTDKKLEVKDFAGHFRARFQQLQRILMSRPELQSNLVSINKISSERTNLSIIGIVKEKRVTKNKNLILKLEDLTGEISALIKFDREDVFEKADELLLDDIIGVKASGNKDLLFVQDIFYPDSLIYEKVRFESEDCIAFLSDMHCGSDRHLKKSLSKFLEWINSEDETARRIKYIFFVGDNVDGVGIFPGQEEELIISDVEEQYAKAAELLGKIRKDIKIIISPGNHDALRIMEPQRILDEKYA